MAKYKLKFLNLLSQKISYKDFLANAEGCTCFGSHGYCPCTTTKEGCKC